jgi:tetratricopeptide (TPR) repeat protein
MTNGEHHAAALRRAKTLCEQGRHEEAVHAASRAIATDPHCAWAWCAMAAGQLGLNQPKRALAAAQAASSQRPDIELPHRLASHALGRLGREQEAIEAAETAVRLAPQLWLTHLRLARALTNVPWREEDAARARARVAVLMPDQAKAHLIAGNAHLKSGRPDQAAAAYRRALTAAPDNTRAHDGLARLQAPKRHSPTAMAEAVAGFARVAADPRRKWGRHNLDSTIRTVIGWVGYLAFVVACVAVFTAKSGQLTARLAPIALLLIPAGYVALFLSRLPGQVRDYVAQMLVRPGPIRLVVLFQALMVISLLGGAVAPHAARRLMADVAVLLGLGAWFLIGSAQRSSERELGIQPRPFLPPPRSRS